MSTPGKCQGLTKENLPCQREVKDAEYCWQHQDCNLDPDSEMLMYSYLPLDQVVQDFKDNPILMQKLVLQYFRNDESLRFLIQNDYLDLAAKLNVPPSRDTINTAIVKGLTLDNPDYLKILGPTAIVPGRFSQFVLVDQKQNFDLRDNMDDYNHTYGNQISSYPGMGRSYNNFRDPDNINRQIDALSHIIKYPNKYTYQEFNDPYILIYYCIYVNTPNVLKYIFSLGYNQVDLHMLRDVYFMGRFDTFKFLFVNGIPINYQKTPDGKFEGDSYTLEDIYYYIGDGKHQTETLIEDKLMTGTIAAWLKSINFFIENANFEISNRILVMYDDVELLIVYSNEGSESSDKRHIPVVEYQSDYLFWSIYYNSKKILDLLFSHKLTNYTKEDLEEFINDRLNRLSRY